jgi:hypothetical protein
MNRIAGNRRRPPVKGRFSVFVAKPMMKSDGVSMSIKYVDTQSKAGLPTGTPGVSQPQMEVGTVITNCDGFSAELE